MAADDVSLKKKALAAHIREQVSGPVGTVLYCAEGLLGDARAQGFDETLPDLERIHTAATQLLEMVSALMDPSRAEATGESDFEGYVTKLRHDLRTPINAVKGYGEMLLEDAESGSCAALAPDLRQLLSGADNLLSTVDVLVRSGYSLPVHAVASHMLADVERAVGAASRAQAMSLRGRILVVDDNEKNCDVLERRLLREGHQVATVPDGPGAFRALSSQPFDLVLLDMMMPGMNGYEVLTGLKADEDLCGIPVIMISALDEINNVVRCIEAGAEDYLVKPFNPVLLRARIGSALENKRLRDIEKNYRADIERDLIIARDIQSSLMPKAFPPMPAVAGHGLMVPAREVGGDFFDFIPLGSHSIGVAVGDVSGKGVPAAFFMAVVRTLLRTIARFGLSPGECLRRLNDQLSAENEQVMFVSLFYGILDTSTGVFVYANGGHNWPAILRADGTVEKLEGTGGFLVGVLEGLDYEEKSLRLAKGDLIFIYTDGVVEAFDAGGNEYTWPRLERVLESCVRQTPRQVAEAVLASVQTFEHGIDQADDITCVALRYGR